MRANRERGEHGTENAGSCSGPNGEAELVVALLPSHMDASWMHDHVIDRAEIIVFRGRVPFIDPTGKGRTQPRYGNILAMYGTASLTAKWSIAHHLNRFGWRCACL